MWHVVVVVSRFLLVAICYIVHRAHVRILFVYGWQLVVRMSFHVHMHLQIRKGKQTNNKVIQIQKETQKLQKERRVFTQTLKTKTQIRKLNRICAYPPCDPSSGS
jgi:hypothetical protein